MMPIKKLEFLPSEKSGNRKYPHERCVCLLYEASLIDHGSDDGTPHEQWGSDRLVKWCLYCVSLEKPFTFSGLEAEHSAF